MKILKIKNSKHMLSSNPNLCLKIINQICNKYNMFISEFDEFNEDERDFKFVLHGLKDYIVFKYDYENDVIIIETNNNYIRKDFKIIFNTDYKRGEIVIDIYNKKYCVLEDFCVTLEEFGMINLSKNKVKVKALETNEKTDILYFNIFRDVCLK